MKKTLGNAFKITRNAILFSTNITLENNINEHEIDF